MEKKTMKILLILSVLVIIALFMRGNYHKDKSEAFRELMNAQSDLAFTWMDISGDQEVIIREVAESFDDCVERLSKTGSAIDKLAMKKHIEDLKAMVEIRDAKKEDG